ncbi:putative lipoprotein signal peptidase LspA [Candidatus Protochlamydia naegleriophila]|uniref:Lipoprotein signal peptidase n=1 Tax=Candidatus Protochlamydia naegleriophila TaxID=389348 RepID=A0A0U5EU55_9BACT|nr:signal peptidase II [Candidatus Protochlamydia naegleriophila]CUI17745.1 putative lipoprotein signal peptidase LspA [Candidatus Protochlamydia naegleriophila]
MCEHSPVIMASNRRKLVYQAILIGMAILLADQLSKFLVYRFIPLMDSVAYWYPYGGIGIFKNVGGIEFSINHMTNKGAAWGMFGNYQLPLVILRMGLIAGLCVYLFCFNRDSSWQIPLILIIAGAVGNVADFFLYGHVVDMLHFVFWGYDFPIFNVADSAISIGIGLLFVISWFKD